MTWCGEAPSVCQGCRAPSLAGRVAGRAPAAGGSEGVPENEDEGTPHHPGCGRQAWQFDLVEKQRKLLAGHGKACGLWWRKCVVSAAADDDDADAEPLYHCHGDDPSQSLGAETATRCCRGGEHAAQTVKTFPA